MLVPDSLSLAELKQQSDLKLAADEPLLERLLEAAFMQAQAPAPYGCGRLLEPDPPLVEVGGVLEDTAPPVTRRVRVRSPRRRVVVPDARQITAVTADGTALAADGWETVLERDGVIVQIELAETCKVCEITGRFGFLEIPANLKLGIYILAARAYYERDARYADQVAVVEGASASAYYRQLPPATKHAFGTFTLPPGVAGLS